MTWIDIAVIAMLLVALGLSSPKLRAAARGWVITILIAGALGLLVYRVATVAAGLA